ncbi:MAG: crossover junction endodeoxyribonuclease RuvC [Candidatus Lloydbacteria bacterium]|nr:crossover junction endodeoxyribonuclease RuvC [Candidatus Lloydbacteria bacterium]
MKVLAIDPGFERLGVAVLEGDASFPKILYSACFKTSPKDPFEKRLGYIGGEIISVIKKYKPEVLAIETLFFTTNQKTAMRVAEVRGAIIYLAVANNLSVSEYTPLQIKIAVTGYGRADKKQVIAMVTRLSSIKKGALDDEYDAIAIGITHLASYKAVASKKFG